MTTKTSIVLAAFAAAIAAQSASANTVGGNTPDTAVATSLALIRPSTAALEQLESRIEQSRITVARAKPFSRVFVEENGPTFVQSVKKLA